MEDSFDRPGPKATIEEQLAEITHLRGDEATLGFNLENPTQEMVIDPRITTGIETTTLVPDKQTNIIYPQFGEAVIESDRLKQIIDPADQVLAELRRFSKVPVRNLSEALAQMMVNNQRHVAATVSGLSLAAMMATQAAEISAPVPSLSQPAEVRPTVEKVIGAEQLSHVLEVINSESNPDLEVYRALLEVDPAFANKHLEVKEMYNPADPGGRTIYDLPSASYTLSLPDGAKVSVFARGDAITLSWQAQPGGRLSPEEWMVDADEQIKLVQQSTNLKPTNINFSKDPDNPVAQGDIYLKDTGGRMLSGKVEANQRSQIVVKLKELSNESDVTAPNTDQAVTQTEPNG